MAEAGNLSDLKTVRSGVDRSYGRSSRQKLAFFVIHTLSVALCFFLVTGGIETVGGWFGRSWSVITPTRAWLVLGATVLYWARHSLTLFYLIVRRVTWSEALPLGTSILVVEVGYCFLGCGIASVSSSPVDVVAWVGVGLVVIGSYLTTWSELQRKWWKAKPENKGRCYTEGLFRLAAHINYFGDVVLSSGWSILTATWWTFPLPVLMTAGFIFYHIPGLDGYLSDRYGEEFHAYAQRTKKLIPFIY